MNVCDICKCSQICACFSGTPYRIIGPSCSICSRSTRGLSLLRSLWINIRVSCTRTDGRSVKSSVKPCQILSPAERYVVLRYNAAVVSAVNRETETSTELGSLIITQPSLSSCPPVLYADDSETASWTTEQHSSGLLEKRGELFWRTAVDGAVTSVLYWPIARSRDYTCCAYALHNTGKGYAIGVLAVKFNSIFSGKMYGK